MYVNRLLSAQDNMLALLNETNDTELTFRDLKFAKPVALPPVYLPKADPEDPDEPQIVDRTADNTSIIATGIGDYSESVTLTYRRLDLDFEVQYLRYLSGDFVDWADFKSRFAVKNDVQVEDLVFSVTAMPTTPGINNVDITPVADSPLYFGTKSIKITVPEAG